MLITAVLLLLVLNVVSAPTSKEKPLNQPISRSFPSPQGSVSEAGPERLVLS